MPVTTFGIDYAWGRPSVASMKAGGVKFAIRYLSHDTTGKNLSKSEAVTLAGADIWTVVIWESTASRARTGGFSGGKSDATLAAVQAETCGMPRSRPIYFAVDFDATSKDWPKIAEYFKGAISVLGLNRVGMYGGYYPITKAFDANLITWGWQTYAWSGGRRDPRAQIYQYANDQFIGGVDCDFDNAYRFDYGQWMPGKLPVPPAPGAPPFPGRIITQPPVMRGNDVEVWQAQMKKRGWNIVVDGDFGPNSERVLRAFQDEKGMMVDGELGPKSWRAAWEAAS